MAPVLALAERPSIAERYDEATDSSQMVTNEAAQSEAVPEAVVVEQVRGDVLELQPGDTITISPLDFPKRGMSMDKVENELGRPIEIQPAVGEPPITRWSYADRVVFFEHSRVIHVVERR
jgi:hypothetical protein